MFTPSLEIVLALSALSVLAGFLDSIAGGAGLLMLPALLLAGVPPQAAMGTNKFTGAIGISMSLVNYIRSKKVVWNIVGLGITFSVLGGLVGSRLVLFLPELLVGRMIVFLLPLAMLATLAPRKERETSELPVSHLYLKVPAVTFLLGFYNGFFGPGTGSFLILAFHFIIGLDLVKASATAKLFNLASCLGALVLFILEGKVLFLLGLPLAICSLFGHYLGSNYVIKKGPAVVKPFLFLSLLILFVSLLWKYFLL